MGDTSSKGGGGGFGIRMAILLILLALAAFGFYYDRFVLGPNAEKKIEAAFELINKKTDDGFGVPKDEVQKTIGFKPQETTNQDDYEVETYRFSRALPFMQGQYITVVYQNGALSQIIPNDGFDPNKKDDSGIFVPKPEDRDPMPNSALAGGGGGGGGGDSDDSDDSDDGDDGERERPDADDSDDGGEAAKDEGKSEGDADKKEGDADKTDDQ